jgi:hypothetical protein
LRLKVVRWALLNCAFVFMFHGNYSNQVLYRSKFCQIKLN